jgi:hypothetical protein
MVLHTLDAGVGNRPGEMVVEGYADYVVTNLPTKLINLTFDKVDLPNSHFVGC